MANLLETFKQLDEYIKSNYMPDDKNIYNSSKKDILNFNECRIQASIMFKDIASYYKFSSTIVSSHIDCVEKYIGVNEYDNYMIWKTLTYKVTNREIIGFPLLLGMYKKNNSSIVLYFLKMNLPSLSDKYVTIFKKNNKVDEILFQKLFILYNLWELGYYSDNYIFELSTVPETFIQFKIKDLYFNFKISYFVMLSPKTILKNIIIYEQDYINSVLREYNQTTQLKFIKYFITKFINYFDLTILPVYPSIVPVINLNNICTILKFGSMVRFTYDDRNYVGYLIDRCEDICEVLYITPDTRRKAILQFIIININEIYEFNGYVYPNNNYIIGDIKYNEPLQCHV